MVIFLQVKWGDKKGGYGEHYFDINHGPQYKEHGDSFKHEPIVYHPEPVVYEHEPVVYEPEPYQPVVHH